MKLFSSVIVFYLGIMVLCCFSKCKKPETNAAKSPFQKEVVDGSLNINLDGQVILSYAIETRFPDDTLPKYFKRSGFIHPLKTKSGVILTDDFPRGHTHQHGLFTAWRSATFRGKNIDFWNQAAELGIVKHSKILDARDDSSISVEMESIALTEKDSVLVLDERWDMEVLDRGDYYIIDWQITQDANGKDSLILDKYTYGGVGFRGNDEWNTPNSFDSLCYFKTNDGLDQTDANHTRPLWASMYGKVGGKMGGIGIIQGKKNLRYPQFIRVHPSMPYYCFLPTVEEAYTIGPDDQLISDYRLVVFDGEVDPEVMKKEMDDFNNFSTSD